MFRIFHLCLWVVPIQKHFIWFVGKRFGPHESFFIIFSSISVPIQFYRNSKMCATSLSRGRSSWWPSTTSWTRRSCCRQAIGTKRTCSAWAISWSWRGRRGSVWRRWKSSKRKNQNRKRFWKKRNLRLLINPGTNRKRPDLIRLCECRVCRLAESSMSSSKEFRILKEISRIRSTQCVLPPPSSSSLLPLRAPLRSEDCSVPLKLESNDCVWMIYL